MLIRVAVVTVIALLSGCGTPAPLPSPTSSETGSVRPVDLERPYPDLPLTCEQLAPSTTAALLGGPIPLVYGPETAVRGVADVTALQAGVLTCEWRESWDLPNILINVSPDGATKYDETRSYAFDDGYTVFDTVGDRSHYYCGYGSCVVNVLVSGFFLSGVVGRPDLMDELDLAPLVETWLREGAEAIRRAAAEARTWSLPSGSYPGWGACHEAEPLLDGLRSVFGRSDLIASGGEGGFSPYEVRGTSIYCALIPPNSENSVVVLYLVQGGSWAWDEIASSPATSEIGAFERVRLASGSEALISVNEYGGSAYLVVKGSLVHVLDTIDTQAASVSSRLDGISTLLHRLAES
jgi:hypothetical protein